MNQVVVVKWAKILPVTQGPILSTANTPVKASEDDPSDGALVTHVGGLDGVSGCWLLFHPTLVLVPIWGVNYCAGHFFLSYDSSVSLPFQ